MNLCFETKYVDLAKIFYYGYSGNHRFAKGQIKEPTR